MFNIAKIQNGSKVTVTRKRPFNTVSGGKGTPPVKRKKTSPTKSLAEVTYSPLPDSPKKTEAAKTLINFTTMQSLIENAQVPESQKEQETLYFDLAPITRKVSLEEVQGSQNKPEPLFVIEVDDEEGQVGWNESDLANPPNQEEHPKYERMRTSSTISPEDSEDQHNETDDDISQSLDLSFPVPEEYLEQNALFPMFRFISDDDSFLDKDIRSLLGPCAEFARIADSGKYEVDVPLMRRVARVLDQTKKHELIEIDRRMVPLVGDCPRMLNLKDWPEDRDDYLWQETSLKSPSQVLSCSCDLCHRAFWQDRDSGVHVMRLACVHNRNPLPFGDMYLDPVFSELIFKRRSKRETMFVCCSRCMMRYWNMCLECSKTLQVPEFDRSVAHYHPRF